MAQLDLFTPLYGMLSRKQSRVSNTPELAHGPISKLPADLMVEIADLLPARYVASLSLACKSLYLDEELQKIWKRGLYPQGTACHCGRQPEACPKHEERYLFLELLEKDLPGQLLCDFCQKFHPQLSSQAVASGWIWPFRPSAPRERAILMLKFEFWNYKLGFEHVQKVMNRDRWGEPHGEALESIALHTGWRLKKFKAYDTSVEEVWITKFDAYPRIHNNQLMLHTCQRLLWSSDYLDYLAVEHPPEFINDVLSIRSSRVLHSCNHKILRASRELLLSMVTEVTRSMANGDRTLHSYVLQCNSCLTESSVSMYGHREQGIEIMMRTWTNLGSCRHSSSPEWLTAAWLGRYYSTEYVKDAWRRLEGTSAYIGVSKLNKVWISGSYSSPFGDPEVHKVLSAVRYPKKGDVAGKRRWLW